LRKVRETRRHPLSATYVPNLSRGAIRTRPIQEYCEALRPTHADTHYRLGFALGQKADLDGAIQEYRKALRLNPAHADTHYRLGAALDQNAELDGAIQEFREMLRLDPGHTIATKLLRALGPTP
jgi:Flp pilus assembly protein TadD